MKIPFLAFIFQGIPEQIAVATLAFVIAKAFLDWKRICLIGLILACSAYVLRSIPISFGVHTTVLIGLLFFLIYKFGNENLAISVIASAISFIALTVFEITSISILMYQFNITQDELIANVWLRILFTWPQILLLFSTAYLINFIRKNKGLSSY